MAVDTEEEHLRQLAFLEFNLLRHFNESHLEGLRGAEISAENTVLWDLNGQPLLHRHALIRDDKGVGFIDVGVQRHSLALFQTASRNTWDPDSLIARAETEAKRLLPERSFSAARFVCYSFPRVAVQLLDGEGAEVLMLSVGSWAKVPPARHREAGELISDFERWSFLEEHAQAGGKHIELRIGVLDAFAFGLTDGLRGELFGSVGLSTEILPPSVGYSGGETKCQMYLIPQENDVWCVPASVQMTLRCFNRQFRRQSLVADALLQNGGNPQEADPLQEPTRVADAVAKLSEGSLEITVQPKPQFGDFQKQIEDNGPVLCQISGHMYVVTGYKAITSLTSVLSQTLLVYDPEPPGQGSIGPVSFAPDRYINNYNIHRAATLIAKLRRLKALPLRLFRRLLGQLDELHRS